MRVHISLVDAAQATPDALRATVDEIKRLGLTDVNEKRLAKFGLLSGDLASEQIALIEKLPQVRSVSPDHERRTSE
ncbi:MAG: hypothetical protein KDA41_21440 [Planctomycetales bacterium]|nr:hypothetical protein [Planctomycetales bacterium]